MEKSREITIKGIGKITAKPDFVIISINIEKIDFDYTDGYESFARDIKKLQTTVEEIGFSKEDLKTSSINSSLHQEYENKKWVTKGYKFSSSLKLSFDFNAERLGKTLEKLSKSSVNPQINIDFTVKNKEEIKNQLLNAAAQDAKKKAEILCNSLGVTLGQLQTINYSWKEICIYSDTKYEMLEEECSSIAEPIEFTPEDIDLTDNALFIWEIK